MTRVDIAALLRKAKARKAKRVAKRRTLYRGKPSQSTRTMLRKKLDGLWSMYIKKRDMYRLGHMCRICGKAGGAIAYHIVPKQRGDAVRWLKENGVLACTGCNYGEVMRRADYRDKHVALFGRELVEGIEEKARRGAKFSRADLVAMAEDLRRCIEGLRKNGARQESDGPGPGQEDTAQHGKKKQGQAPQEPGLPVADDGAGEGPDVLREQEAGEGTGGGGR